MDEDSEDAGIQAMFTPELIAEIEAADAEIEAGNFVTPGELDEHLRKTRDARILQNKH